jgi:pyruvate/2-oxoglutarate dehydrogenase complex dihydrolipoamide acyltransferase (E2) component
MAKEKYDVLRDIYTDANTLVRGGSEKTVTLERSDALPLVANGTLGPPGTAKALRQAEEARQAALQAQQDAEAEALAAAQRAQDFVSGSSEEAEEANEELQNGGVEASPAAQKKADELNVDLTTVEGTGTDGNITVKDVERASGSGGGQG